MAATTRSRPTSATLHAPKPQRIPSPDTSSALRTISSSHTSSTSTSSSSVASSIFSIPPSTSSSSSSSSSPMSASAPVAIIQPSKRAAHPQPGYAMSSSSSPRALGLVGSPYTAQGAGAGAITIGRAVRITAAAAATTSGSGSSGAHTARERKGSRGSDNDMACREVQAILCARSAAASAARTPTSSATSPSSASASASASLAWLLSRPSPTSGSLVPMSPPVRSAAYSPLKPSPLRELPPRLAAPSPSHRLAHRGSWEEEHIGQHGDDEYEYDGEDYEDYGSDDGLSVVSPPSVEEVMSSSPHTTTFPFGRPASTTRAVPIAITRAPSHHQQHNHTYRHHHAIHQPASRHRSSASYPRLSVTM